MTRPYWLDEDGRPVEEGVPFSQHVRDFYHFQGLERMRSFRAELHHHGDAATARQCLNFGGCVAPSDFFRSDYLSEIEHLAGLSQFADRVLSETPQRFVVAAPVTPPLSPMGGTHCPKLIKKRADLWAKNNAY